MIFISNYFLRRSSSPSSHPAPKQPERTASTLQSPVATIPSQLGPDDPTKRTDAPFKAFMPADSRTFVPRGMDPRFEQKIDLPPQEAELAVNKLAKTRPDNDLIQEPTETSNLSGLGVSLPPLAPPVEVQGARAPIDLHAPAAVLPAPTAITPSTFAGGWALSRTQCAESGEPPLRMKPLRAEVSTGHCDFRSVTSVAPGSWRIDATCVVAGKVSRASIKLSLSGDTLTWSSGRGIKHYARCDK
jgi:hypothetical protein